MSKDEDKLKARLAELKENPDYAGHPLMAELEHLVGKYGRLARQLRKITRISDQLQVQMMELNQALEQASMCDPLTSLPNRRYMMQRLRSEVSRAERSGRPFTLVMADIDRFKEINDTFGHEAGDYVLLRIAEVLQKQTRAHDACARWGGEEFLILYPDTDTGEALRASEKLRRLIAELDMAFEGQPLTVTMSFGICGFQPGRNLDAQLREADHALYAAKESGRNRCVLCALPVESQA